MVHFQIILHPRIVVTMFTKLIILRSIIRGNTVIVHILGLLELATFIR